MKRSNKNGVLRAGVVNDLGMPFSLIKDGQLIGFDIELSSRFAAYTGREYQPVPLQFGSLIASIATHKIDIITASMFITEERKKMIDFSDPYYESGGSIIARNERIERAPAALLSSVDDLAGKKIGLVYGDGVRYVMSSKNTPRHRFSVMTAPPTWCSLSKRARSMPSCSTSSRPESS